MLGILLVLAGVLLSAVVVVVIFALVPFAVLGFRLVVRAIVVVARWLGTIASYALGAFFIYLIAATAFALIRDDPLGGTLAVLLSAAALVFMFLREMGKLKREEEDEKQRRLEQSHLSYQRSLGYEPDALDRDLYL